MDGFSMIGAVPNNEPWVFATLAIDAAASKHLQSKSEYIRQSAIENLKADGIDPSRLAGAA